MLQPNHYSEINESCQPYGLDGHRHQPEIAQEIDELRARAGLGPLELTFVPHLVPMTRGILATCYARLGETENARRMMRLFEQRKKPSK